MILPGRQLTFGLNHQTAYYVTAGSRVLLLLFICLNGILPIPVLAQDKLVHAVFQSVDDLIATGLESSPEIQADRAAWQAALLEVPARRALPEPNLGYSYYLESVETRVGPQKGAVSLSQRLPWLGKLRLEGRIAEKRAEVAYYEFAMTTQRVAAQIEDAYWDYQYLQQAISITGQNVDLLRHWEKVALSKYTTAQAGHPDIIKIQVEVLSLEDQLTSLEKRQRAHLERLSAAIGRPLAAEAIGTGEIPATVPAPGFDSLAAKLFKEAPALLMHIAVVDLTESTLHRMRLNYLPDASLGGNIIFTGKNPMLDPADPANGTDPFVVTVGISLPFQLKKYRSLVQSARARQRAAELAVKDGENHLRADLEMMLFDLEDSARKARLYKEALLPRAEQSLRASEKAYIADKVDFLTLIEAQRVLLNYQLLYQKVLAEQASQNAQLNALLGRYPVSTGISGEN